MTDKMPELQDRIRFLRQTVPPDDIYLFAEHMVLTASVLVNTLALLNNMETVALISKNSKKAIDCVEAYNAKYREGDTSPIDIPSYKF